MLLERIFDFRGLLFSKDFVAAAEYHSIIPVNLKTEYLINPLGIDIPSPRFSWELISKKRTGKLQDVKNHWEWVIYEEKIGIGRSVNWATFRMMPWRTRLVLRPKETIPYTA